MSQQRKCNKTVLQSPPARCTEGGKDSAKHEAGVTTAAGSGGILNSTLSYQEELKATPQTQ